MKLDDVKPGLRVQTTALGDARGMFINRRHLDNRAEGRCGSVKTWVPGHGGDVWFVEHDDGTGTAAYCFDEFEPIREDAD